MAKPIIRKYPQIPKDAEPPGDLGVGGRVITFRHTKRIHEAIQVRAHSLRLSINEYLMTLVQKDLERAALWPYTTLPGLSGRELLIEAEEALARRKELLSAADGRAVG